MVALCHDIFAFVTESYTFVFFFSIEKGGDPFEFVLFWRYGRVVRRGTANPFSPVQIRVSPDRQEN